MAQFYLMHYIPDPRMRGLYGYTEVIESVAWGLRHLGHGVDTGINKFASKARNIVFGAHLLPSDTASQLPDDSIVYNLEQLRHADPAQLDGAWRICAERFEVWDYSPANLSTWRDLRCERSKLVPIGYAPVLTRIPKPPLQDIDVLLYGLSGAKRMSAVHALSAAGVTVVFVSGLFGAARDQLIARSKIVLNVNLYDSPRIFEIVRVSYLLANRKAVVATMDSQSYVEEDIGAAVRFTPLGQLVAECRHLLEQDKAREGMEAKGLETMAKRRIGDILEAALA